MAEKVLIKNTINGRTYSFSLPCSGAESQTFCDNALEGTYHIFYRDAEQGNSNEPSVIEYTITGKSQAGHKATFSFYSKPSIDEAQVKTALAGKTFNGVKFDDIYIISARTVK